VRPAFALLTLAALAGCNSEQTPAVNAPEVQPFQEMARTSTCADKKNRLFLIDGAFVFWDKAGSCADASYSQTLFGATPQDRLCEYHDSIAGPRRDCTNAAYASMFDTILAHLDEPDLGLGPGHTVRPISL
jgi:hypothetical protein